MKIAIIIGNGFSISLKNELSFSEDLNKPWGWEFPLSQNEKKPIMDLFPRLKHFLSQQGELKSLNIYDSMEEIIKQTSTEPMYKVREKWKESDYIHHEACHYLRLAYSWISQKYETLIPETRITKWLLTYWENIETALSYNYDINFENILRYIGIGIAYSGSFTQSPLLGHAHDQYSEISLKKVIKVAKPHGSCNFSGWVNKINILNGVQESLYPIKNVIVRDSSLKILPNTDLMQAQPTADLILPGEYSYWNDKSSYNLEWANEQKENFVAASDNCDTLLVFGFGYGLPDQCEFDDLLKKMKNFRQVIIINPDPDKELIEKLKDKLTSCDIGFSIFNDIK